MCTMPYHLEMRPTTEHIVKGEGMNSDANMRIRFDIVFPQEMTDKMKQIVRGLNL